MRSAFAQTAVAALLLTAGFAALAATSQDSHAAGDVEEARVALARTTMPAVFDALAPVTLSSADDEPGRAGLIAGRMLWRSAADRVGRDLMQGAGDDRPLYWQRLAALRAARAECAPHPEAARLQSERQSAPSGELERNLQAGAQPEALSPDTACSEMLTAFEAASRGMADVIFDAASDVKVLVTGFDPFLLDRDLTQSNPSGVAALYLDDARLLVNGRRIEIQTLVVPVRFADFDEGLIEKEIVPLALRHRVDLLITVSMGRDGFDLERFPGRRRSASAPDNRNLLTGGSSEAPVLPRLDDEPLAGPEFVEFTLPAAAMVSAHGAPGSAAQTHYGIRDNRTVTTLEDGTLEASDLAALSDRTAVRGGGGGYLSNEISYRVLNALTGVADAPRSGHIHTPRISGHDADALRGIVLQTEALVRAAALAIDSAQD